MFVVITGASRGIGRSLAYLYASHRYNLILTCEKNISILEKFKIELEEKYNINVIILIGNVYDNANTEILKNVKNKVFMIINNQSKANYHIIQDISEEDFANIVDSNMKNPLFTTKYFIDEMIKNNQGIIINISSVWGVSGAACEILYSMTKGAINTFTKSLSKELCNTNIEVIGFSLGMVDTDMNNNLSLEEKNEIAKNLLNNRMMTPDEVAQKIYDTIINKNYEIGSIVDLDNGLNNF